MSNTIALLPIPRDCRDESATIESEAPARRRADGLIAQVRGRRVLLAGTAITLWIAAAIALPFLPDRYTATATVFVGSEDRMAITAGHSPPLDESRIENEMSIIASRPMAERVIAHLKLDRDPDLTPTARPVGAVAATADPWSWIQRSARSLFTGPARLGRGSNAHQLDRFRVRMIDTFLERLRVARHGESRVIEIAFTSASPERAAAIANALAQTYVTDKGEKTFNRSKRASEWMGKRLSELRRKADESAGALTALRQRAGLNNNANAKHAREITELRRGIAESDAHRAGMKATLDKTEELLRNGRIKQAVETLSSERLRRLHAYIASLQREHSALSRRIDPGDRQLVHLRDETGAAKQQFEGEVERILQGLRNEINVSLAKQNSLRFRLSRLEKSAPPNEAINGTKLESLQLQASANRALYDDFLSRVKETTAYFGGLDPTARITSRADIPLAASFPPVPEYLAIAFGVAWLVGLIVVLFAACLDRGFRSLEQIEDETDLPGLALIPSVPGFGLWGLNPEDYLLEKPISAYSEAVRSMHTGLLLFNIEAPPRVVMVTSAAPNEGKTSLAISFARMVGHISQKRVVLVDCDLRHPQVDHKLGLERGPGLVEYLMEEASFEEVLQVDEQSNALVIAAGRAPLNSAGLFGSDRFKDLLDKLSEVCDLVVLDSAPVLAVSDSRVLARLVDQTIFVARWAKTRREVALRAINEIRSAGGAIGGVVLTRVNVRQHARFDYSDSGIYRGAYLKYYSG